MAAKRKSPIRLTQEQLQDLVIGRSDQQIAEALRQMLTVGGPKTIFNLEELAARRAEGCTDEEIAEWFRVSRETIRKRKLSDPAFRRAYERGGAMRNVSLRRMQMTKALNGDTTMLIWLGKQELGQRDHHDLSAPDGPLGIFKVIVESGDANL